MEYHIEKPDETIKQIVNATFPNYKGRSYKLSTNVPHELHSYWSGGSRTYYAFYELATRKTYSVKSNSRYESENPINLEKLPSGIVLVAHTIFCGRDLGITIYANQEDLAPLLPAKEEVSEHEKTVLLYTQAYKSSYAGIKDYRFYEANKRTGITKENWMKAKENLIAKKLLRKNGSISPQGRNAIANENFIC